MMKKSPLHEACYGLDLQKNFSQFLEESKQNVNEVKLRNSSVYPEECGKTGLEKAKKDKKSWKRYLISWWKANKKSKHEAEPTNSYGKRKGHVSGPIYYCGKGPHVKQWRPTSGPLTSLFKPTKREEGEIPYMPLNQQNYGPLYLVT
ncbi:hypothetical protein RJT34_20472 [Clitoria ternatea]|uniref:Uncharacterized protein n=1 Tax=Clitoria ternatea TaxID=43366 RepID=A0AAN9P5U4_CLITE